MKFSGIVVVLIIVLLTGCAPSWTVNATRFSAPQAEPVGMAALYIYRPHLQMNAFAEPMVYLNDKAVGRLKDSGYLVVMVPPGSYQVRTGRRLFGALGSVRLAFAMDRPGSYLLKFDHAYKPIVKFVYNKGIVTASTIHKTLYERWLFSEPRQPEDWREIEACYQIPQTGGV